MSLRPNKPSGKNSSSPMKKDISRDEIPKNEPLKAAPILEQALLLTISKCSSTKFTNEELRKILHVMNSYSPRKNVIRIDDKEADIARPLLIGPESGFLLLTSKKRGDRCVGIGKTKIAMFAVDLKTAQQRIVTISKKKLVKPRDWIDLQNEIQMLQRLKNIPEIIHLDLALMTEDECYLIEEYCNGGHLFQALAAGRVDPQESLLVAQEVAKGVKEMHDQGVVHRDLKPENLFLIEDEGKIIHARIGDFGTTAEWNDDESNKLVVGSLRWVAPEKAKLLVSSLSQEEKLPLWLQISTEKTDVWALGCLFFALFRGGVLNWQYPRQDNEPEQESVRRCAELTQEQLTNEIHHSALHPRLIPLIEGMLQVDPHYRFNSTQVYEEVVEICKHFGAI